MISIFLLFIVFKYIDINYIIIIYFEKYAKQPEINACW